ncbi:hypothetical protein F5Y18DRAFT_424016 [Xylariaceae sp. FL1019]|nr:hypothetical protein F5Y18DRAFT_424016 [Xylariaceae sp. FL1019]
MPRQTDRTGPESSQPNPNSDQAKPRHVSFTTGKGKANTPGANNNTRAEPTKHSQPDPRASPDPRPALLRDLPVHYVQNTPAGLVLDGVLESKIPQQDFSTGLPNYPVPQPQPYSYPFVPIAPQAFPTMSGVPAPSSVAAGIANDPNQRHYQPPVPDTSNGPIEHTYVPRSDQDGSQFLGRQGMVPPILQQPAQVPPQYGPGPPFGVIQGAIPGMPGAVCYGFPGFAGQQVQQPQYVMLMPLSQPGMATAPIAMVPQGAQCQPMPQMQYCVPAGGISTQPGAPPMMVYQQAGAGGAVPGQGYVLAGAAGSGGGQPPSMPTFLMSGGNGPPAPGGGVVLPGNLNSEYSNITYGKTKTELDAEQLFSASDDEANSPQGCQPEDPNPGRMYWCEQLDGEFVQVSRQAIDRGGSEYRWYMTAQGVFYAKRLPP